VTLKEGFLSLCAGQSAVALPGADSSALFRIYRSCFQEDSSSVIKFSYSLFSLPPKSFFFSL